MEINLPERFMERMRVQLGSEADAFFDALDQPSPTSIRLHHAKGRSPYALKERVKWCDTGYYLETRPSFHLDPHWHGGAYYVQEASSMVLDEVVKQLSLPTGSLIWLDMCAAPGGKTGILAKHLREGDVLVANEVVGQRRSVLKENLIKGGYADTFLTGLPSASFPPDFADIILIDAPCAGEGMMRKEPEAIRQWSPQLVSSCSVLQQQIVRDAVRSLRPGGILIYSTCSYSEEENIKNINSFVQSYRLENQALHFPKEWNIDRLTLQDATGYQLFPHRVHGEGLFFAVLRKTSPDKKAFQKREKPMRYFQQIPPRISDYLSDPHALLVQQKDFSNPILTHMAQESASEVLTKIPRAELISSAGEIKGKDFIPSHYLAMSGFVSPKINTLEVSQQAALDYLERKIPGHLPDVADGWHLVTFEGTRLGWLKKTLQGWKNHYPMNWRLRHRT